MIGDSANNARCDLMQAAPTASVVSLSEYVIEKCCSGSAEPAAFLLGYEWVARESDLRARQIDYLVHLGNAVLTRARAQCRP